MVCGGPSKEYAYKKGEEAFEEIYKLLCEKYSVWDPPEDMWVIPDCREEHKVNKDKLKASIQELIWNCDVMGW